MDGNSDHFWNLEMNEEFMNSYLDLWFLIAGLVSCQIWAHFKTLLIFSEILEEKCVILLSNLFSIYSYYFQL